MKRNFERKESFKNMKKETIETLEKKTETKETESQTDSLVTSTGMNTDKKHEDDYSDNKQDVSKNTDTKKEDDNSDDTQDFDKNRQIRPKDNETILEMRVNHEDLDEKKIETFISKKFSLIGKPWIANDGRHFVTVGFKTWTSDYEKWKVNSVNWQDSGIRAVYFSQLYHQ